MGSHHLRYPLPYPLPGFFSTTLPEPYPKSKNLTRHIVYTCFKRALPREVLPVGVRMFACSHLLELSITPPSVDWFGGERYLAEHTVAIGLWEPEKNDLIIPLLLSLTHSYLCLDFVSASATVGSLSSSIMCFHTNDGWGQPQSFPAFSFSELGLMSSVNRSRLHSPFLPWDQKLAKLCYYCTTGCAGCSNMARTKPRKFAQLGEK